MDCHLGWRRLTTIVQRDTSHVHDSRVRIVTKCLGKAEMDDAWYQRGSECFKDRLGRIWQEAIRAFEGKCEAAHSVGWHAFCTKHRYRLWAVRGQAVVAGYW